MCQKAKSFKDHETATTIPKEKGPIEQKTLGSNIKGFRETDVKR